MFIKGQEVDIKKIANDKGVEDLLFLLVYMLQNGKINCGTCRKRMDKYLENFCKKYKKEEKDE